MGSWRRRLQARRRGGAVRRRRLRGAGGSARLNVLSLGDEEGRHLGIVSSARAARLRRLALAAVVAVSGMISFVILIVPRGAAMLGSTIACGAPSFPSAAWLCVGRHRSAHRARQQAAGRDHRDVRRPSSLAPAVRR
jgi:hypothetical protein